MKEKLRQQYLEKRKGISKEEKKEKSYQIKEKLFSLSAYKKANTVMFYCSFEDEVETIDMIKEALNDKRVLVPRMNNNKSMDAVEIKDTSVLQKNKMGILEPTKGDAFFKNEIDLMIIPAVAFDLICHRVGYGHGYYDRFLEGVKAVKAGVAYDIQITNEIPAKEHDVPVDYVITEKRIIKYDG